MDTRHKKIRPDNGSYRNGTQKVTTKEKIFKIIKTVTGVIKTQE